MEGDLACLSLHLYAARRAGARGGRAPGWAGLPRERRSALLRIAGGDRLTPGERGGAHGARPRIFAVALPYDSGLVSGALPEIVGAYERLFAEEVRGLSLWLMTGCQELLETRVGAIDSTLWAHRGR